MYMITTALVLEDQKVADRRNGGGLGPPLGDEVGEQVGLGDDVARVHDHLV